jgi:hypothetical protein
MNKQIYIYYIRMHTIVSNHYYLLLNKRNWGSAFSPVEKRAWDPWSWMAMGNHAQWP